MSNIFGLLCVVTLTYPSVCTGHTKTYQHDLNGVQISCYLCEPGQFYKGPCSRDGGESDCETCPVGQYNTHSGRAQSCATCDTECKDPEREEVERNCSATSNISCICREGFYRVNKWPLLCTSLDECPPGNGVKKRGNRDNNTICEICTRGFNYSGITSKTESCQKCTKCSMNETVVSNCTLTNNTICAPKEKEKTKTDNTIVIIGSIIGIIVPCILAVIVYCRFCRKRGRECIKEKVCRSKSVCSDVEMNDIGESEGTEHVHLMEDQKIPNGKSSNGAIVSVPGKSSNGAIVSVPVEKSICEGENYPTVNELTKLADDLTVPEYPTFFRCLFEEGADKHIEEKKLDYKEHGTKEIVYQIFKAWQVVDKEKATKAKVLKTLEEMGWNEKTEKYRKLWELPKSDSGSL
ncbi:hypothetical protein ACF0H5_019139 [Mactra antiquata]